MGDNFEKPAGPLAAVQANNFADTKAALVTGGLPRIGHDLAQEVALDGVRRLAAGRVESQLQNKYA